MASSCVIVWSILILIAAGNMNRRPIVTLAASAETQEDRSDDLSTEDSSEELTADTSAVTNADTSSMALTTGMSSEGQTRKARSAFRPMGFHSELQEDMPLAGGNLGLPARKLSLRKRRSGVVIRGPFYPYPKPGHPFRFTSGASGNSPSSWSTIIVVSGLAVNMVALWRT
ncbi:uncharacterized protein [Palaemon carinicauda]|uniref:uncharacterized protein n=1 Tax=Palaemon carinicauda TaxID=392227 RepID=UPI0035B5FFA8